MRALRALCSVVALSLLLLEPAGASCDHSNLKQPSVVTLAGSGAPGSRNGLAHQATFVGPVGVAVAADGSIYVADEYGQAIRHIKNGVVQTVAGVSSSGPTGQDRIGGYVDGPVSIAKFNHPSGIAVARDGTVFVADSGNRTIRKIAHGMVSTLTHFGFSNPHDIAIDGDGNLYVADFSVGVRKIARSGAVTPLSYTKNPFICGVSARGSGKNMVLAYTDRYAINIVSASGVRTLPFTAEAEPQGDGKPAGFACRLAVYDQYTVIVSDIRSNTIRFVRFGIDMPIIRALAGGNVQVTALGGDRDGPIGTATVDLPGSLALAPGGSVVFADTGSRKIREVLDLDPRGPLYPGFQGLVGPANRYRVAVIGASFVSHNVLWSESMAGQIESGLAAQGPKYGLRRCPFVVTVRLSGMSIADGTNFIKQFLSDGEVDLVVYQVDSYNLIHDIEPHPELAAGDSAAAGWLVAGDRWKSVLAADIADASRALQHSGAKLLMVPVPQGPAVSPLERPIDIDESFAFSDARDANYENAIASSGVPTLRLLRPLQALEEQPNRVPYFNTADPHPSPQGQMWIGQAILQYLEGWRPWSH